MAEQIFIIEDGTLTKFECDDYVEVVCIPDCVKNIGYRELQFLPYWRIMMENQKDMQTRLVPGVGRMPYPAYRGKEPYVFISYARLDSERVFAEIKRFNEGGFTSGMTRGSLRATNGRMRSLKRCQTVPCLSSC